MVWHTLAMPERSRRPKRPRDINQLAKSVVDIATKTTKDKVVVEKKNPAAVALGRLGGAKGGMARAASLSPEERSDIAKRAAIARWKKKETNY